MALILTALFSTVAMAEEFKAERLSDVTKENIKSIKADYRLKKQAINDLPEADQAEAKKALRSDFRENMAPYRDEINAQRAAFKNLPEEERQAIRAERSERKRASLAEKGFSPEEIEDKMSKRRRGKGKRK